MITPETYNKPRANTILIDESFEDNQTIGCDLLLEIGCTSIQYAIVNGANRKVQVYGSFGMHEEVHESILSELLADYISKDLFLNKKYARVIVSVINKLSTLVPEPLYSEASRSAYLETNFFIENQYELHTDSLKGIDAKNVFGVNKNLIQILYNHFPNSRIVHFTSFLIDFVLNQNRNSLEKKMVVNVQLNQVDIIVVEGKKLLLSNSFVYKTAEDFIYYVLFVLEQLKLNPETIDLQLYGKVERNSTIFDYLYKYIRNVKFGDRPSQYLYTYKLNNIPQHQLFSLFCLS